MAEPRVRCTLTAVLLSDAHIGSGAGGGGIDALLARDRYNRPVIWASHLEGVLRDSARRLASRGDEPSRIEWDSAVNHLFGRSGGERQRAIFTSLYSDNAPMSHIWQATARQSFHNRSPKDDTLRVVEYVPSRTKFTGELEIPESLLPALRRLLQEIDSIGGGRASGSGRVVFSLAASTPKSRTRGNSTGRLILLLESREPICITATATPDNLIPSQSFIPGRTLLGAVAAWLIAEGHVDTASLLAAGRVAVSDALPVPHVPTMLASAEAIPAPLSLQSRKPRASSIDIPWWAQPSLGTPRLDAFSAHDANLKLKRPEDDLFLYRGAADEPWMSFRPARRVRLRNGRPDPKQADASLFAIEQIAERTHFLCELRGSPENMDRLAASLNPVLSGDRWLRIGRAGAPVEVAEIAWTSDPPPAQVTTRATLTLTSDLLLRDHLLRWCTAIDQKTVGTIRGFPDGINCLTSLQDTVMIYGFNGTARLWRTPCAGIRRGSVFEVSGEGVAQLAQMAARGEAIGERTHEGFGRFRVDAKLPGLTDGQAPDPSPEVSDDLADEALAEKTFSWYKQHWALSKSGGGTDRKPSLSQWYDLVADLERDRPDAIDSRLQPATAGAQSWKHPDALSILHKLRQFPTFEERAVHARFFVRWLRAAMRKERK